MAARAQPGRLRPAPAVAVAAGLAALAGLSLLLRSGSLHVGYWIDEAIAVGIAQHSLDAIPGALRQDGSPPLYYLLLHEWIRAVGPAEAATRALSLGFALLCVPAAWWAGRATAGVRAGAIAAIGAAACPFLTLYGQETRMYSLVALLSLLAAGSFVLAFAEGRRAHVPLLGVWLVALLYTHTWAPFLVAGFAVGWLVLWRQGRTPGRDGAPLVAAVAACYAPWVPSLLSQAAHTGAPWSERPSPLAILGAPIALFGAAGAPLLAIGAVAAIRRRRGVDPGIAALLVASAVAVLLAWTWSQIQPAWAPRYLAIVLGPLLLAVAAVAARGTRVTLVALVAAAISWLVIVPPVQKSNARAVADAVAPAIKAGDLIVSTQPEQVPVLDRYLPRGQDYLTPLGVPSDPQMVDWRNALHRLRHGHAARVLDPALARLRPGQRVVLVTPAWSGTPSRAPWIRAVRARTREWRRALRADPHLRSLGRIDVPAPRRLRSAVRAQLFTVRASG